MSAQSWHDSYQQHHKGWGIMAAPTNDEMYKFGLASAKISTAEERDELIKRLSDTVKALRRTPGGKGSPVEMRLQAAISGLKDYVQPEGDPTQK